MTRKIIGAIFTVCGTILFSAILISSAIVNGGPTPMFDLIQYAADPVLTFLFYFSIIFFLFGVTCLFWNQFNQSQDS